MLIYEIKDDYYLLLIEPVHENDHHRKIKISKIRILRII